MARWIGSRAGETWPKKRKNTPTCDVSPRKLPIQNEKIFSICTRRLADSLETLNSSLAQLAHESGVANF